MPGIDTPTPCIQAVSAVPGNSYLCAIVCSVGYKVVCISMTQSTLGRTDLRKRSDEEICMILVVVWDHLDRECSSLQFLKCDLEGEA